MPKLEGYISKQELYETVDGGYDIDFDELPETKAAILESIENFWTADVRENVRGEWKVMIENETFAECKCTNCGAVEYFNHGWKKFNFCPNCGADMREVQDDKS